MEIDFSLCVSVDLPCPFVLFVPSLKLLYDDGDEDGGVNIRCDRKLQAYSCVIGVSIYLSTDSFL